MSTDTSGANLLPDRSSLHQSSHNEPGTGPEWEPAHRRTVVFRDRWWQNLPEEISARRARRTERAERDRLLREADHQAGHPGIPLNLIETLQRGLDHDDSLSGTTIRIDGRSVHVAVSSRGTGIPEPDSQGVWDAVCATYREVSAAPHCADIVLPLPQEIAAIGWTTPAGQTVTVTPCKPQRLRAILSVALIPLARMGELGISATTGSAAAALALGTSSLSPVPVPIATEPTPDLRPKTSVVQQLPQVDRTTRPELVKVSTQVRPSVSAIAKTTTRASTPRPRPATTPTTAPNKAAMSAPATPSPTPEPAERPEASSPAAQVPAASEPTSPTIPVRPTGTGLETLLPSVPSLLQARPT